MAVYWWADDDPARAKPESPGARTREIDTLFHEHDISYDISTLLALVRLTWKTAGELVYDAWRATISESYRPDSALDRSRRHAS